VLVAPTIDAKHAWRDVAERESALTRASAELRALESSQWRAELELVKRLTLEATAVVDDQSAQRVHIACRFPSAVARRAGETVATEEVQLLVPLGSRAARMEVYLHMHAPASLFVPTCTSRPTATLHACVELSSHTPQPGSTPFIQPAPHRQPQPLSCMADTACVRTC
jgi:hypothetical protein